MSGSSSQSRTNNKRTTPNNGASGTYAALGDSVAAGLGLPLVASPSTEDQECGRSSEAYGQIVASKLHDKLIFHACSGATAGDLFTQQHIKGPNPPAQLDGVFAHGTPELITVTAGANDAHWQSLLKECYATNCDTKTNTVIADGFLKVLQLKLYTAMYDIQARSHGTPPEVIFTGYYDPLSQQCSQQQSNITPQELSWIAAETSALNQTIKNVTQHFSFAKFATVDFTGHDLCSSDSWIQGLNASAPFHPTARGQQAIANSVLAKVNQP
jgi:lysophospholipase L1-like esterase